MVLVRCGPKISKLFKNFDNLESTASGTWIPSQNKVNIQAKYAILNLVLTFFPEPTQDLGKINYFEFSPDLVLTFDSRLGQVLINN